MLFLSLVAYALADGETPTLGSFIMGEWIIKPKHGKTESGRRYVEIHDNEKRKIIECTIWRDDMNSTEVMTIDNYMLGYYEIEFENDFAGQVYTGGDRTLVTDFSFQPVPNTMTIMTKAKLDSTRTLQLTFVNATYWTAVVAHKGVSRTDEYIITRMNAVEVGNSKSSLKNWMYIGLAVIAVQLLLFMCLRCCRSNMDARMDRLRSEMVIDLDKVSEVKEKAE